MIKGQDIVVLTAIMAAKTGRPSYAELARRTRLSVSEAFASVKRLRSAMLVDEDCRAISRNVTEFLVHAIRYLFPSRMTSGRTRGIPTSYAAPVATDEFAVAGDVPVWRSRNGTVYGRTVEPLYATAPEAAANDRDIYDRLAVIDMLRGGRLRERAFAERKLKDLM